MVGRSENMDEDMIKISVSIKREERQFLDELVSTGRAASRSHAVRMAVRKLEDESHGR